MFVDSCPTVFLNLNMINGILLFISFSILSLIAIISIILENVDYLIIDRNNFIKLLNLLQIKLFMGAPSQ